MDGSDLAAHIANPARLAALRAVSLLDTPSEECFDRLSRLATLCVKAPVALVTLVDADRQFFKSCLGIPEPWLSRRETPLSHSFCQHNRVARQPLLIEDARLHPLFKDNLAVADLKVIAYLGIPLVTSDGYVLGSFCVIDSQPRKWTMEEVTIVETLAASVMTEIELRSEVAARKRTEADLEARHDELKQAYRDLELATVERVRALEELRQRDRILIQQSRLAAMGEMINNIAHQWRQPLNVLALLAQDLPATCRAGQLSIEYLEGNVAKMMEAIRHMSGTIDNFRNFFSPSKEKVPFSLRRAVEKALSLVDLRLNEQQLNTELIAAEDCIVSGYENEYSQVLLNILINARDAFLERKVADPKLVIEIGREGDEAVVTITDNAGGIPEEILERIFDPYFTTKGPDRGTGIGLYMSKMIVERNMGGSLTVKNVPGGARFRVAV